MWTCFLVGEKNNLNHTTQVYVRDGGFWACKLKLRETDASCLIQYLVTYLQWCRYGERDAKHLSAISGSTLQTFALSGILKRLGRYLPFAPRKVYFSSSRPDPHRWRICKGWSDSWRVHSETNKTRHISMLAIHRK